MRIARLFRAGVSLPILAALAGCAAQGQRYADVLKEAGPVPEDHARIVLLRPDQRFDNASLSKIYVRVNEGPPGRLAYGGFLIEDVPAGVVMLAASAKYKFHGVCRLALSAAAGDTFYLDVAPRPVNIAADVIGAAVSGAVLASAPTEVGLDLDEILIDTAMVEAGAAGTAASTAVSAIEAAGKACGGPYRMKPIAAAAALDHLKRLSSSE